MQNEDYREILAYIRELLRKNGLGAIDERLVSELKGQEGAFFDLRRYLDLFRGEISLGTDATLSGILRRFRRHVRTQSGEEIAGIRMTLTEGDGERLNRQFIDFEPDASFTELAKELQEIIALLDEDYRNEGRGNSEDE
jgi:hypothetical protein